MGKVVDFPTKAAARPWSPAEIRVGLDFSRWCVAVYIGGKLSHRRPFDSEAQARAEAAAMVASGRFAQGPDLDPGVYYYGVDGGDDCA